MLLGSPPPGLADIVNPPPTHKSIQVQQNKQLINKNNPQKVADSLHCIR